MMVLMYQIRLGWRIISLETYKRTSNKVSPDLVKLLDDVVYLRRPEPYSARVQGSVRST